MPSICAICQRVFHSWSEYHSHIHNKEHIYKPMCENKKKEIVERVESRLKEFIFA